MGGAVKRGAGDKGCSGGRGGIAGGGVGWEAGDVGSGVGDVVVWATDSAAKAFSVASGLTIESSDTSRLIPPVGLPNL